MAKLDKAVRDSIRKSVREARMPFRPSSQNRFSPDNLEQIYHREASAGDLRARAHVSERYCRPLDHDEVSTTGI